MKVPPPRTSSCSRLQTYQQLLPEQLYSLIELLTKIFYRMNKITDKLIYLDKVINVPVDFKATAEISVGTGVGTSVGSNVGFGVDNNADGCKRR